MHNCLRCNRPLPEDMPYQEQPDPGDTGLCLVCDGTLPDEPYNTPPDRDELEGYDHA